MTEDDGTKKIALAEYKEVVSQFRKLTDIRFKLLTYLPLGTVTAALVSPTKDFVKQRAISAFALVVTLCIATYDKRNDQYYDELVSRAAELERDLGIERGSFSDRPKYWLKYGFVEVDHRWAIGLLYAAAMGLWAYLFVDAFARDEFWTNAFQSLLTWPQQRLMWLLILLKLLVPVVAVAFWWGLRRMGKHRKEKLEDAVKRLMKHLLGPKDGALKREQDELVNKILGEAILGFKRDEANRRVAYHWEEYKQKQDKQKRPSRSASALLAAVIDLPARWIEDVWTGRR